MNRNNQVIDPQEFIKTFFASLKNINEALEDLIKQSDSHEKRISTLESKMNGKLQRHN